MTSREFAPVDFDVPAEVAFDYLLDPRNRPQWQSSLRSVVLIDDGGPRVGMRWYDVTKPGLRPEMAISAMDRPVSWTETGHWRGVDAVLTLTYEPTGSGCRVRARFAITGRGFARPFGPAIGAAGSLAIVPDLKRAARILSERSAPQ